MTQPFNSKALTLARESRGLTQKELSELVRIPQSNLSKYENGYYNTIDEESLKKLSDGLRYPPNFFKQQLEIFQPNLYYRKRVTVSSKLLSVAEATMNIYRANIQKLLQGGELQNSTLPTLDDQRGNPQEVAAFLRQFWKIPRGAIDNLTKRLEDNGIIVVETDFLTDKIDGRSMTTERGNYILFYNKHLSGDRQRFTLAHELGHIMMHLSLPPVADVDVEKEANLFASEFLMPEREIKPHLVGRKLSIAVLADMKRVWKTSMQAILKWAEIIGAISTNHARYLWSQISTMGIKKKEPIEIPVERPTLLKEIIDAFIKQLSYSREEIANMLCLNLEDFMDKYFSQHSIFRIERNYHA